jgi:hypothetical protein
MLGTRLRRDLEDAALNVAIRVDAPKTPDPARDWRCSNSAYVIFHDRGMFQEDGEQTQYEHTLTPMNIHTHTLPLRGSPNTELRN